MTLPDPAAAFKEPARRPRRRWLFLPYAIVIVGFFLWSIVWLEERNQVALAMDRAVAQARGDGLSLDWKDREIGGYPFRIEVTVTGFNAGEPSGWSLSAPSLKAVAEAYDLNHWVFAAENGADFARPGAGVTHVTGKAIRASWVGPRSLGGGDAAPRIVAEGLGLTFATDPGAKPFPLTSVGHAEVFTRTEPDGRLDAGLLLENAQPRASSPQAPSLLADLTGDRPFAVLWQGIVSHPKAFAGANAQDAAQAWAKAGGTLTTVRAGMSSNARGMGLRPGVLTLDPDGRVQGEADLVFFGVNGDPLRAMGRDGIVQPLAGDAAGLFLDARAAVAPRSEVDLTYRGGVTNLGPVPIGPAPKPF
jgi:hypothetical protein